MFRRLALLLALSSAAALRLPATAQPRAAVSMQFGRKKPSAPKGRPRGEFYDDEVDTTSRPMWTADSQYGNTDNGDSDLATEGGIYYLAVVPFLLFALAYATGNLGNAYSNGNY